MGHPLIECSVLQQLLGTLQASPKLAGSEEPTSVLLGQALPIQMKDRNTIPEEFELWRPDSAICNEVLQQLVGSMFRKALENTEEVTLVGHSPLSEMKSDVGSLSCGGKTHSHDRKKKRYHQPGVR
jgi:hypothetical protein